MKWFPCASVSVWFVKHVSVCLLILWWMSSARSTYTPKPVAFYEEKERLVGEAYSSDKVSCVCPICDTNLGPCLLRPEFISRQTARRHYFARGSLHPPTTFSGQYYTKQYITRALDLHKSGEVDDRGIRRGQDTVLIVEDSEVTHPPDQEDPASGEGELLEELEQDSIV